MHGKKRNEERTYLRCGGELEPGTIPDRGHGNYESDSVWRGPKPPPKKVFGLFAYQPTGEARPVRALRCVDCGMLELVAEPDSGSTAATLNLGKDGYTTERRGSSEDSAR